MKRENGMKKTLRPRMKLWLSTSRAEGVFGDGKWRLLKAIDQKASLRAATASLGISYRKAWGDLQKAETQLGIALIEKHRGGKEHGSASLTEEGRKWLKAYSMFRSDVEKSVEKAFKKHVRPVAGRRPGRKQ
jgi:molybdate transport system regulatory protein